MLWSTLRFVVFSSSSSFIPQVGARSRLIGWQPTLQSSSESGRQARIVKFIGEWAASQDCADCPVQPWIRSTIREFFISSVLWVLGDSVFFCTSQYLSNRSLHIMVDGCQSKLISVVPGVQQSSALSPLWHLLYS